MERASLATCSPGPTPRCTRPSARARTRSSAPGSLWGMGLLDEAIKEHLELKRRHGADPAEVAQQEREAFGPARRGPEPLEVPPPADEAEPVDPVLIEPEVD